MKSFKHFLSGLIGNKTPDAPAISLYHGSNEKRSELALPEKYARSRAEDGHAVYLSNDAAVSSKYGKVLHSVNLHAHEHEIMNLDIPVAKNHKEVVTKLMRIGKKHGVSTSGSGDHTYYPFATGSDVLHRLGEKIGHENATKEFAAHGIVAGVGAYGRGDERKLPKSYAVYDPSRIRVKSHTVNESTDYSHLKPHPIEKMRDYTDAEKPWEYREYTKYAKPIFPRAFDSEEHFWNKYKEAPLRHLTPHELHHLDYSTAGSYTGNEPGKHQRALSHFAGHRDLDRIQSHLDTKIAPPIVLKHSRGMRILGGNTRLSMGLSQNINLPVKIVDISERH